MPDVQVHAAGSLKLTDVRFADFGEFAHGADRANGFSLDFAQLDRGRSPGAIMQVGDSRVSIVKFELSRLYAQRGATPAGHRTFGILEENVRGVRCWNTEVTGTSLTAFRTDGDFEAVSQPGFVAYALTFREEVLEETAETLGIRGLRRLMEPVGVQHFDPKAVQRLRRALRLVTGAVRANSRVLDTRKFKEALRFEIPARILNALASTRVDAPPSSSRFRQTALKRARSLLDQSSSETPSIRDICRVTGVSWRTLIDAFRENLGVTPKAYLQAVRLNRVRERLLAAKPSTKVADVANLCDFWHMGQFAADYRSQFGELPSETLKRSGT